MTAAPDNPRRVLLGLYREAVERLSGRRLTREALLEESFDRPVSILAVGKAALAMTAGAMDTGELSVASALVVHPVDQAPGEWPAEVESLAAEHPIPGEGSFRAGERALEFVASLPPERPLLVLLSGGGSSLMEWPRESISRDDLVQVHQWLLASGLDIVAVNRVRQAVSAVKGGALARRCASRDVRVFCIADVPPGHSAALASGPFLPPLSDPMPPLPDWIAVLATDTAGDATVPEVPHRQLADAASLRETVRELAEEAGLPCHVQTDWLEGDAADAGRRLAEFLLARPPGLWIWAGETTVTLPAVPGRGGRCQQLALAAAERLAGRDGVYLLACGSDGLDGPEGDAGALVDGGTLERGGQGDRSVEDALDWADAGRFLANAGDLVTVGPTGTNVNDLVIGWRLED